MGEINKFVRENLVIGVLAAEEAGLGEAAEQLKSVLEADFGPIDLISRQLDFTYTSYYDNEMGSGIKRWFYSFKELFQPEELSRIKIRTNELELLYAVEGKRKVNLDPGLLDLNRLILATTKNVGHRIPLSEGIYGEVTLLYMKKDFRPLDWTYPDYRSPEYIEILKEIRTLYRLKLKQEK